GRRAIYYANAETAQATQLPTTESPLLADRISTRFVRTEEHDVQQLQVLPRATSADELVISSISHDHQARVRSVELLAEAWHTAQDQQSGRRSPAIVSS